MIKWILAILLFVSATVNAQIGLRDDSTKYIRYQNQYGSRMPRFWADSAFHMPYFDTAIVKPQKAGAIMMHLDNNVYKWNGGGWEQLGGTSTILNNVGTGYNLVAAPSGNVKRLNNGYGILIDSATSNTNTAAADTSSTNHLVTQSDLNDAIAGAGMPTAGYGIGVTGSQVRVDTTVIDSRYRKVFNVVLYGADPDSNSNDDCPAIKAAIAAAYTAGGGIVYFPLGHYTIGCTLQHSVDGVDPDAQIVLPLARDTASRKVRITFEGEAEHNWSAELVTVRPKVRYGVILESTIADTGYVFGSSFYNDGAFGGDINWNWWAFKNIEIRVRTKTSGTEINNTMSGINAEAPRSVDFDHVKVTVQSAEGNMLEPASWTTGVKLPHWNNNGNIVINNLNVSGYYNGVVAAEHMNATELITFNCHNGLYLPYAFHSGYIGKYTSEGCVNHIYVSNETGPFTGGPLDLHIGSFNVEHYTVPAQWNTYSADVTYADTSSPSRVFLSYAHMAESGVGKVSTFNTNAPQRVTIAYNGVNGASDFLKDNGAGSYMMNHAASTTVDNNIFKLGSTAQTGGFIFGSTGIFDYTSGPHIGARGNTYSAFSNQRGIVFIAGGQVSSPTGNEGSLLFQTQNVNRMIIGYSGGIKMPYLTKSGSTTDSALYPNPSTGDLELRPVAGASTPSLQTVLNAGRTGDTIVLASSSGTNRDIQLYNENAGVDDLAVLRISGRGTNAGSLLNVIPKGSGFSGIQSQVGLWNTSDEANPEVLQIRATGSNYIFNSYKDASGSLRPIKLQMGGTDVLSIAITGALTINSSTNSYILPAVRASAGQVLTDVAGNGTLSWETPSGGLSGSGSSGRIAYWNGASSLTSNANFLFNGSVFSTGTTNTQGQLNVGGNKDLTSSGAQTYWAPATYTDQVTAASGTASSYSINYIGSPTIAAANTSVTFPEITTFTIEKPLAGTNATLSKRTALRVNGLLNTTEAVQRSYSGASSDITLDNTYDIVAASAASGNISITLPTASGTNTGLTYTIKRTDNSGNTCTVVGTIDGATNYSLTAQYKYVTVTSNGTNWYIIANN